jgi:hypothetical protein
METGRSGVQPIPFFTGQGHGIGFKFSGPYLYCHEGIRNRPMVTSRFVGAPPLEAKTSKRSLSARYDSGLIRRCPDLAPVVVNRRLDWKPATLPPLLHDSSVMGRFFSLRSVISLDLSSAPRRPIDSHLRELHHAFLGHTFPLVPRDLF